MGEREVWEVALTGELWALKHRDAERASQLFDLKTGAVARGVELASAAAPNGQLIIKRADGTIEDERTYGNDPYPQPG